MERLLVLNITQPTGTFVIHEELNVKRMVLRGFFFRRNNILLGELFYLRLHGITNNITSNMNVKGIPLHYDRTILASYWEIEMNIDVSRRISNSIEYDVVMPNGQFPNFSIIDYFQVIFSLETE
jgi:hypothetical protein